MDLEFNDLKYTVTNRTIKGKGVAKTQEILKSVSGKFHSGQLSAIIGPSGAGKSSLLNALSGYRSQGVTGELLAGGRPRDKNQFHKRSCYITQEDLLQPLMTVGELMALAAALKMPKSEEKRQETVDTILKNLSLAENEHTRTENLSGGQKKRLSIALELINNPPIFFLDEPTSGLDQVTSTNCIRLLRSLARQGRTVVCTIHQPSASIFEQFDQVYVLAQGMCIYQGGTSALVPFLLSVGLPCPIHHNPADFVIEVTEDVENITKLSDVMQNGKLYQIIEDSSDIVEAKSIGEKAKITDKCDNLNQLERRPSNVSTVSKTSSISSTMAWMKMRNLSTDSDIEYATSGCTQFKFLLLRMLLQLRRNRIGFSIQTAHHLVCGFLIGLCFYGTANEGRQMFNHLKFCIGITVFFAYTQIMVPVLLFPMEVKLVKKEYFNRWYGLLPYYAALTISKLPLQILLNVVFCSIVYFMWGLPAEALRFSVFCLVGNMVSLCAEGVGLSIGSNFSVTNGCAMGPFVIAPFFGLGIYGFDFTKRIPVIIRMIMRTSFIRCGIIAMALTVFGLERPPLECNDDYCFFSRPDMLLNQLDIKNSSVWVEILLMAGILCFFRGICYLGLRKRFAT